MAVPHTFRTLRLRPTPLRPALPAAHGKRVGQSLAFLISAGLYRCGAIGLKLSRLGIKLAGKHTGP